MEKGDPDKTALIQTMSSKPTEKQIVSDLFVILKMRNELLEDPRAAYSDSTKSHSVQNYV